MQSDRIRGIGTATRPVWRAWAWLIGAGIEVVLATGCGGRQSALDPAGRGAGEVATLFWWMTGGALAVWAGVVALTFYVVRRHPIERRKRSFGMMIIGGGAVLPTVILTALLAYGLSILPRLLAPAPPGSLQIRVTGEQWWWRVRYEPPDAEPVDLANEIRLPVGEWVEFQLESPDVIHSFWIPSLGGKMDMIPGRRTRIALQAERTGVFRGVCAEYCGMSHALMAFDVIVMEKPEFDRWLAAQRQPATPPVEMQATLGRERFFANGCSACHTVRGTAARGFVGPDLTHVGSRLTLGAGIVPNDRAGFMRWIARTDHVKPGVHMPHFGMLPAEELEALAAYLEALQ